jgi:long-chain acyl-CoA synthetase
LCVLGRSRPGLPAAERLHAVVVADEDTLRARGIVNVNAIIRFELEELAVRLPAHKRVLTYDIAREPLPRTTTGKLRRGEIERRWQGAATKPTEEAGAVAYTAEDAAWLADQTRGQLINAIGTHLGRAHVRPNDNLELDLGLDSMERVELLTALESALGRQVGAEARARIFTVRQLVEALIGGSPGSTGDGTGVVESAHTAWHRLLSAPPDPSVTALLARPTAVRAALIGGALRALSVPSRCLVRWRVAGRANLPPQGPYLICPNHQSYLDGFLIASALPYTLLRQLFLVGAAEYFQSPLTKWIGRTANIVPVDADANLVTAMRAAAAGLSLGKVLLLFPEGERSIDGRIKPFRKGAAILAAHLRVPIVPVSVSGLHALWPRGLSLQWRLMRPWQRPTVTIRFGTPLTAGPDYDATTALLQQQVTDLVGDGVGGRG